MRKAIGKDVLFRCDIMCLNEMRQHIVPNDKTISCTMQLIDKPKNNLKNKFYKDEKK